MKRSDVHRPSAIIPADYEFVDYDYYGPELVPLSLYIPRHMKETGGDYSEHQHGGTCHVCGASCIYVGIFYHAKTNSYVALGHDCATKMELAQGDFATFKKNIRETVEAAAGKRRAEAFLTENGLSDCWPIYMAKYEDLPQDVTRTIRYNDGNTAHPVYSESLTIRDIVNKLVRYGSISEKQVTFLRSLLGKIATRPEREAKFAAEKEAAAPCPTGRTKVHGIVIKVSEHDTDFGATLKMTVKASEGYVVWATVPSGLQAERGQEVTFVATLTPSENDPKFGFAKRPKLAVA